MRRKISRALPDPDHTRPGGATPAVRVGHLVSGSVAGALVVDFDGNGAGPLAARATLSLDDGTVAAAVATRRKVVLLFENGDPRLPLVVGLLDPSPGEVLLQGLLLRSSPPPTEARVDGRRVVLEGQDEVVLKCGEASITLRRDGKIMVHGAYVESRARGVNRIKGGAVKIN